MVMVMVMKKIMMMEMVMVIKKTMMMVVMIITQMLVQSLQVKFQLMAYS